MSRVRISEGARHSTALPLETEVVARSAAPAGIVNIATVSTAEILTVTFTVPPGTASQLQAREQGRCQGAGHTMKLLIQPGDGVAPIVKAISRAKNSIEIVVFRFDQREVEHALASAVSRGVAVHALIAHTNKAGEENLRRLEMRFLGAGITLARTADDLVRYHGKMMLIDRRELFLLGFNLTH